MSTPEFCGHGDEVTLGGRREYCESETEHFDTDANIIRAALDELLDYDSVPHHYMGTTRCNETSTTIERTFHRAEVSDMLGTVTIVEQWTHLSWLRPKGEAVQTFVVTSGWCVVGSGLPQDRCNTVYRLDFAGEGDCEELVQASVEQPDFATEYDEERPMVEYHYSDLFDELATVLQLHSRPASMP